MATRKRGAAPNEEMAQMYRARVPRPRIAELMRVSAPTVGYHLRLAAAKYPGLHEAHESAASTTRKTNVTARGLERMRQLVAMVQESGRYPSGNAGSISERTLAVWLQRRREEARAGTLAQEYRDGLAVLDGWAGRPRAEADEDRWQERLTALVAYRAMGNDWPRHKAEISGEEHELGVWMHAQRYKARCGELDPTKVRALDEAVPGWRMGRRRGKKRQQEAGTETPETPPVSQEWA